MLNPQICPEEPSQRRISHSEVPRGPRLPSPTTKLHILNTTYGPESIAKARKVPEGDITVTLYSSSNVEYLIYPSKCYCWHS